MLAGHLQPGVGAAWLEFRNEGVLTMARPSANPKTTAEIKALRIATTGLRSAQLTARASKARLRALKDEVKIQKQHYKWARKQVRVAKDTLAEWRTAADATAVAETEPPALAPAAKLAKAAVSEGKKPKAGPAKRQALAIKRHTLIPIAPAPEPSTVAAKTAVILPDRPPTARPEPAVAPVAPTPAVE